MRNVPTVTSGEDNPFAAFTRTLDTFPGGIEEINTWVRELRDDEILPDGDR